MEVIILAIMGLYILIQILFFLYLQVSNPPTPTTSSTTLRGREGFVVEDVKPEDISGKVRILNGNKIWSATAGEKIEKGTKVQIIEADGVHVWVEEVE
ncbi:MAG: NfeD family protein [Candidatus Thermoplasmatota archaeon]